MANELLKTLTIDGVSNDIFKLIEGNYIRLDDPDANNGVKVWQDWNLVVASKTITLENNKLRNEFVYTCPKTGIYFLYYMAQFGANSTGARFCAPVIKSGTSETVFGGQQRTGAAPSGDTFLTGFACGFCRAGEQLGIRLYQGSGTSLSIKLNVGGQYLPISR